MSERTGMLTRDQLRELVEMGRVETVLVVFPDLYGRLVGKRFASEFFLSTVADAGTHACDYLLTADMEMEPVQGYQFANWETGYGDLHLLPDFSTLRLASWLDKTAMILCDVTALDDGQQDDEQKSDEHQVIPFAPRSVLRRQIERAASNDFNIMTASELEYYLFNTSYRDAVANEYGLKSLETAGWYLEDYHALQGTREEPFNATVRRHLSQSGIPVECTKGEWGKGQHELNVCYSDAMNMADNHLIYKQCLKEVADEKQISVTFMAKYNAESAGSSSHVHLSLWANGENAFAGDQSLGGVKCSDLFRWFLAGWMEHVPEMMVFYAPNVNSYKRFQDGSWAPTRIGWSRDNRTAGFRIVGSGNSLRIECRIPGADCNPYLVYAAAIASGLDGIARQLEPPEMFTGDLYAAKHLPHVPHTLNAATELFANSDFTKTVFGDDVVAHYAQFFRVEQAAYDKAVTDWERQRYFDRI